MPITGEKIFSVKVKIVIDYSVTVRYIKCVRQKRKTKPPTGASKMIATTTQCGKCDGTGHIKAFRHIASGCCFWCKGTGVLTVPATEMAKLSDLSIRRIEWLNTVTPERFASLSLDKMETINDSVFAGGGLYQDLVWPRYHSVLLPIYAEAVKQYWAIQKATNSPAYQGIGYAN